MIETLSAVTEVLSAATEDVSSKKRGRKAVKENYFDVREEEAVRKSSAVQPGPFQRLPGYFYGICIRVKD